MAFYPKRLRSMDDLKQERQLLLEEKKRIDEEEFLSVDGIIGGFKKGSEGGFNIGSLLNYLPISNPLVSTAIDLFRRRLSKKKSSAREAYVDSDEPRKKNKNVLKSLAFEVLSGYLKWKAIELSYKGVRKIIKKRKESRHPESRPDIK